MACRGLLGRVALGEDDMVVDKIADDGSEVWTRQLGTSELDLGLAVTTGNVGGVYVAGYSLGDFLGQSSAGNTDFAVVSICE